MVIEINQKLTEIIQRSALNGFRVSFTQYGSKNSIEKTIEMGETIILIQIGDKNDPELPNMLDNFVKSL